MAFETKATITTFGGKLLKLTHESTSTKTPMSVYVYLPPAAISTPAQKVPVLTYLSGLTCTPDNCAEKGFFHAAASRQNIAVVYPDTSPRGAGVAGEADGWDFGTGAGFYVDATRAPWDANYRMETYIAKELPEALERQFGDVLDFGRAALTGHSMGGHGALTLFLKNPGKYRSVSAVAPICNPSRCPWGEKAFSGYLGEDREIWKKHDATELIKGWKGDLNVLIDVGTGDNFYKQGQLLPENLEKAVKEAGIKGVEVRYQPDYDHSYWFISTFAEDHVKHAAKYLLA
ncbi:putative s-formylglutathione hydrolase protein [Eutypa lata UCREL1]|uniref:S-formylglutathione hydrolase n=1 Tax=Eutypa lata (strain UCR-EL1) TaxID=1287681 RepID=M7T1V0_EUTLA|nr:putative s-formylglutathione hydrolase protein [Eutypa lata UCREL1]